VKIKTVFQTLEPFWRLDLMISNQNRESLAFEQAEGAVPLPTQLHTGEISSPLRAKLWE
jgi:hypothetical protein